MTKTIIFGLPILAVLTISIMLTPAFAALGKDISGDATNNDPNFDIKKFGVDGNGNPYVDVYGQAGGTTVNDGDTILAYVLVTDAGIFAVTSHGGIEDSSEVGDDTQFHGHLITLDASSCLTSVTEPGSANLQNKRVSVSGTGATTVFGVLTAELKISALGCVTAVFDSA